MNKKKKNIHNKILTYNQEQSDKKLNKLNEAGK